MVNIGPEVIGIVNIIESSEMEERTKQREATKQTQRLA
jgi:hypothetical protein